MKDWSNARGRMESEIARKKEHLNVATNFQKARGWVRKNWKTKNYTPVKNEEEFLQDITSSSGEENDVVDMEDSPNYQDQDYSMNKTHTQSLKALRLVDLTSDEEYGIRPTTAV